MHLVDYGNKEITSYKNLRRLTKEFTDLPMLAIRCYLPLVSNYYNIRHFRYKSEYIKTFRRLWRHILNPMDFVLEISSGRWNMLYCWHIVKFNLVSGRNLDLQISLFLIVNEKIIVDLRPFFLLAVVIGWDIVVSRLKPVFSSIRRKLLLTPTF